MDPEFVNVYISKLKILIDELIHKNVILETRMSLLEKAFNNQSQELNESKEEIQKLLINNQKKNRKNTAEDSSQNSTF